MYERCYQIYYAALRSGRLKKRPCIICGSTYRVAGHHRDHRKPLKVRWLCQKHHNGDPVRNKRLSRSLKKVKHTWEKPPSLSVRRKISKALKGRSFSDEHRRKIRIARHCQKFSKKDCEKMRRSHLGVRLSLAHRHAIGEGQRLRRVYVEA